MLAIIAACTMAQSALAQSALSYQLNLEVDYDQGVFEGAAIISLSNPTDAPLSELFFRLYANDDSLYGTAFVQILDIRVQSQSMTYSLYLNDTVVLVPLASPLQPGERMDIAIDFNGGTSIWPENLQLGTAATGYGLLTKSADALTLTTFYPMLAVYSDEGWALDPSSGFGDTLMGDSADYTVQLTTQPGTLPVGSGELIAVNPEIESTSYSFTARHARDFSLVLIEPTYAQSTTESEGTTIRTWFAASANSAGQAAAQIAEFSLVLYEDLVGPCPFQEIDLVEVPLGRAAGVEFSGLILVGSQYANDPTDLFFSIIVSHEMAHQWFYAGVGNDVSEHPWLDESFATYLSYEFLNAYYSNVVSGEQLETWQLAYQQALSNWPQLSISSPRYAFPNSSVYSSFVYSGGACFLYDLRGILGNDLFYSSLQAYYAALLYRIATPLDLFRIIRETCTCSIDELLSRYNLVR